MTNKEAINLLDNLIGMVEDNQNSDYDKALKIAIEALSTQPEQNNLMADVHKRLINETGCKAVCRNEQWWGRGSNDEIGMISEGGNSMSDLISRQDAIDAMEGLPKYFDTTDTLCLDYADVLAVLSEHLPSAQPDIIRCKDCRWWDKYGDYDNGYCMAAKHGYWSEHWEISIRRTYKGDFYCADAEMRGDNNDE